MRTPLSFLPALGCGLMTLVCIGAVGGKSRRRRDPAPDAVQEEVAALREEVARLRAERRPADAPFADE